MRRAARVGKCPWVEVRLRHTETRDARSTLRPAAAKNFEETTNTCRSYQGATTTIGTTNCPALLDPRCLRQSMLAALSVSALAFAPSALPAVKPGISRAVAPAASMFDTATAGVPARHEPTQPPRASALRVLCRP